ncbi:unnamed protein product [Schistosoma margrebowiei]|uniref:Uncharacterized protein n=2 Tax=Schistosoma margrebowiei TaxID=48269 RepID=A0AA85A8N2_9TREM|nr:unnamed protein product [Schistosoma margrebowiei]
MTTVWTASSLRRQDGRYNSLSRSLGSLMSIVLDEDKSPSVLIFSNQSPRETNLQTSVSVGDRVGDENILPLNGLSFRSLQTDSSSSIAFVGKKIKREYQSAFVLPDKQTIGIIRQEAFMTEEGLAQVTLSLCVSTDVDSLKVSKSERICDYLDTDYWASILLASTESHDTELLGYMGPEYTSRKPNRFNFERSESRRRKREIVLVQEEIEDSDEKDNVGQFDGSNILPESVTVYEKVYPKEKDECDPQTRRLILHPPPPLPPPQLPESPLPSPPKTLKVSERNASPKPQLTSSRNSCQPKEQAPIIGRAEPPGKTKPIVSSPKSKENFEKLKRQWNNRIAQMQEHLDNQYRDTPTSLPQTYTEGHRGSTVTSILPTVDKRSSDPYVKGRISSTDQRLSPEQAYDHQSLPDRTSMDHGSNKENFIYHSFDYISSSSPGSGDLVDPVTERCEKEAQFIYSQARLFVNQQNIGRLSPRKLSGSDLTYHGKTSYSDIYYKDDPSTDRSEEFIKTLTKYKASSEINYSTKNRILLDIDQNQSPILTGPQLYPSSTDLSSLLSPGGDNFKSYLNRYVERSEKYWSLPKSYFIADEQINKNETTTKQYDSMNITLKDLIYDKFKPLSPTTEAKTDIKLTSNQDTDNLNLHFLKPYKSYRTITTNEKNSQRIKEINQNEKFNTDDLLSKAYYDEMNRLSKRKSLKMDELSSTSSLSILAKAYEEQIENHRKQIDRKSTSIKGNGSKTTDELGEHKSSSKPMKQMNEQENKLMQSDISSDHQRNNLTRDEEVTKFDVQKPSKPEVISNLPPSVLDIPKRLEQNDRLSKHKDLKPDITHQIVTDDKISEKSHKDHLNDQMSKQQELKHHRHPPPPLHHHKSSTKDEILEKFISTGDTHKRSCDGPMSFANFKKNMISDNLPVDEEHSHHQGRHLSHDESKVFSRDSKFRKPIHNNEGQTGTPLAPKHSFEDKHTNKSKMEQQIKTEKPKTQPLDTKASRTSEENHGESMKDQERNELVKRNKTHHQSLRSKQNKPHTSITSKNDRISSWVENSRYQTRQLLQDGMIDVVPQAQPQKSDLKRHQSLNEKRNSYKTDDKMKYRHSDDPSKKPIKKDSITSDYIASQPPKSHYKLNDQKDPTKPLDSNQLNKIDSLKDTHKKSIIEKQQQQDRNNKDNIVKIPDIKQEEKYSSNNVRKQHPSNEVNNLDVEQSVGEIPPHSKQSNSSKIKQPLKEYDGKQSRQSIKKQSYTKDNDDDDDDEGKRENLAKNTDEVLNRSKQSSELDQHKKRKDNVPYRTVDRGNRHLTTTETRSKVTDELPGHRRHPPPPLSPNSKEDIHYPRDGTVSRPRIPDGSKAATPLTPTRHSLKNLDDDPEKRKRQQKLYDDEFKNINGEPMPLDPRKPTTQFNYGILQHPDEYNYLAEAEKQKPTIDFASELSYDSSLYGKISQGSARKQPSIKHYDKYKDKKPDKPHRHPPPPQPTDHDQTKRLDDKPSPKADRRSGRGMVSVDENYYVNVPGSGPPVIRPPYNGHKRSLQDLSERSGPHSAYDPRLGDTVIHPSKPRTSDRISDQMPDYYDQYTSDESDYDDSGESDEELKPPALRTITQTRRRSEPEPSNNYPPVQLRKQSKGQKTGQSITSIRDSLISPEGMSIPSTPGYENISGIYYNDKTGKYMKGLDRDHSNGMSQERISRPRSKHTTATSRSSGYYGVNVVNDTSSKHSLIISTKRRTLSGLTGTHPSKHRSSSMNTLWFGDHPVPSEHTISPATPVRLSNIQIQAQAELERRHRSSSHGHSLDRKSIYSTGMTESHLSKGLSDYHQGYEGIGYAYDNRGRLIHGGACLPERSASRKRRLLDGHESLSRVWIPQSGEHYPVKQISDKTANSLMNRDERQAQLDNSAMAFALRDFNAPKIRQKRVSNKSHRNHDDDDNANINSNNNNDNNNIKHVTHRTVIRNKSHSIKKHQRTPSILNCCMR